MDGRRLPDVLRPERWARFFSEGAKESWGFSRGSIQRSFAWAKFQATGMGGD